MPKISLPEGFTVPEGVLPGEEFDVLATVKLGDEGYAELVAFDGKPIPGYEKEEMEDEEGGEEMETEETVSADKQGFVDSVMAQMGPMA